MMLLPNTSSTGITGSANINGSIRATWLGKLLMRRVASCCNSSLPIDPMDASSSESDDEADDKGAVGEKERLRKMRSDLSASEWADGR